MLELMVPGECQESPEQRAIVVLTDFLAYLGIKDTGVILGHWDHQEAKERMERGEMTETLDPEVSQVNQDLVVCSDPKVLLESPDLLESEEMMATLVPKGTWVHKVNPDLQVSREPRELRECQDLREPLDPLERRVPLGNQACQECLEPTVLLVTQERRGLLEPRETMVPTAPREPLVIPALVASRELKESVD